MKRVRLLFGRLFRSPFGPLYDESRMGQNIRKSLFFIMIGNLCGNIFGTITTGSALTGFAGELGANDFVFGVLTAIPFFGTLMQVPVAMLVSRTRKRKIYMLTYGVVSRFLWIVIGLVPFFIPFSPGGLRIWTVILLVCLSSLSGSFINVCFTSWLADLVPIRIRGRWISSRDRVIAIIGIAVGLLTAWVLDHVPGYTGYAIVFVTGGIIGVLDMLCFAPAVDPPLETQESARLGTVLRRLFADKPFVRFMLFWTAWSFTSNLAGPYFNRYALETLNLSFMQVTICGQVAAAVITVLVISRWGRVIDSYGSKPTLWISCLVTALTPGIMLFSRVGSPLTFLLYNVIGAAFWTAANLTATNMLMSSSPPAQRPSYIAIYSCFTSIAGSFFGVLLGGALLQGISGVIEKTQFTVMGVVPSHYKIIFAICTVTRLACVLLLVPGLNNDRDATFADMRRDALGRLRELGYRLRQAKVRLAMRFGR